MNSSLNNNDKQARPGIVLLVTLVLLVVLATLGYTLSSRLSAQGHRNQYIMDYSQARYGCDSAVKYALATLEDIQTQLISRPNEPDFSDVFALSETQYQQLLDQLISENRFIDAGQNRSFNDINNVGEINDVNNIGGIFGFDDTATPAVIRGPYGPVWPFVTEPAEFEIGSATVRIEIEDENAKYPIAWALIDDEKVQRELDASLDIFCDWMDVNDAPDVSLGEDVSSRDFLRRELTEIADIKPFKLEFKPITRTVKTTSTSRARTTSRRGRRRLTPRARTTRQTVSVSKQVAEQTDHFSKLLHSSLFERSIELLARPTIASETRKESALKYTGMWGTSKVNVNTAPRHVLEAAFAFGGPSDAPDIAEVVIQRRRIKPFENIEDLKQALFSYSDSVRKCEKYITTTSNFFTIKVVATSGVARASSIIAITKDGETLRRVAVISD